MGWKMKTFVVFGIVALMFCGYLFFNYLPLNQPANADDNPEDLRPNYCSGGVCVSKAVFADLPEYPDNFADVKALTYPEPYLGMFEDFSDKHPDESYWKQPEFYGDSWTNEWLKYYTTETMRFRCCSGPYPGDQMVSNLTVGETYRLVTYWHAGPAVWKYQALRLQPTYPEYGKMRMGTVEVNQDPSRAEECVIVSVSPETILIEPTYPKLFSGWTQKVQLDITPKCPGRYFISMEPTAPDPEFERELIRKYGLNLVSTIRSGGIWNVVLEVNG
jgi:hypothetical protein